MQANEQKKYFCENICIYKKNIVPLYEYLFNNGKGSPTGCKRVYHEVGTADFFVRKRPKTRTNAGSTTRRNPRQPVYVEQRNCVITRELQQFENVTHGRFFGSRQEKSLSPHFKFRAGNRQLFGIAERLTPL